MHRFSLLLLPIALTLGAVSCGGAATDAKKDSDKTAKTDDAKKTDEKPEADADADEGPADPVLIERGRYLAEVVMNCRACHTPLSESGPDLDKAYSGGLEYPDTFGTWRSPNITQDQRTGIGGWTDEQIINAVRRGIRPSGEQMYPVMPYEYFAAASDEDMKALVAYLRTIKPIDNAVAGNTDLKLTKPTPPEPTGEPPLPEPVAEGKYLVELAHCGDCHTPLGADGRPDQSKLFAGGRAYAALPFQGEGQVWSANLTPHPTNGIGKYSDDELMTAITELDKRDGTAIVGPMTFYVGAWSQLKHKDVKAIVAYLRSLPPVDNAVPKTTWKPQEAGG
ncbi:MAG: c-type cytochrome [Myxococcales bacterium]|nr:c-type cytochrome [Myxococcales bacterium]MCB9700518.1 c-type cytochrome [Myxococcales bacterium]